ncbi:MAG: Response regulator receiver:ATP-binding region, ATPase-like:Histidine kinase N-terminal [Proteobacteria bacterium]|nr:Response regulator receiver:ATP-binding region, ATPase-like:Histidine kinase N-terminal [Pseudomonadota bacterium]
MTPPSLLPIGPDTPGDEESKAKIAFLYSVFLMAGVVAGVMGFVRWQTSVTMGIVDFGFAAFNFGLLLYLRRNPQKIELVSTLSLSLSFILFLAIYLLATNNTMRLSLFFLLAASGFFLKGRKIGRLWLGGIILAIAGVHFSGLFATGYSTLDISTTCVYLIALFFIFENYESFKEKDRERKQSEEKALKAKEIAEAENRAKSRFLTTMSHEIRTPMNGILGMAQLMLMSNLTQQEQHDHARTILNSGQSLLTLLNDILDFSKIEAGKLDLTPAVFSPRQIVDEAATLFAESAKAKGLAIEANWRGPIDQRFLADPMRLRQMIANLANNAIKFTASGFVRIEAIEIEQTAGESLLEFSVSDSGIGIAPEKLPLLFRPFSQADSSTTREYGGSGLGLSIVHNLANMMGGDAGVESEPGKGSRFWFRVRASQVADGEESRKTARPTPLEMTTETATLAGGVLIVEDNPVNRKVALAMLGKMGISSKSVDNGQEAVEAITRGMRPSLVLMDCQMPVMDGFEATTQIRRWEMANGQPRLPIIALTAGAFEEDRQNCLAAGMDDFLTKPINMTELSSTISRLLGKQIS